MCWLRVRVSWGSYCVSFDEYSAFGIKLRPIRDFELLRAGRDVMELIRVNDRVEVSAKRIPRTNSARRWVPIAQSLTSNTSHGVQLRGMRYSTKRYRRGWPNPLLKEILKFGLGRSV
jgi:hypothetical protein